HPAFDGVQVIVERTRKAALGFLIDHVVIEELAIRDDLLRRAQLHPALEPDAFGVEEVLVALDVLSLPAIGVAVAAEFEDLAPAEGHVDFFGVVERSVRYIEKLRRRLPVVEHTDDAEFAVVPEQGLAHA